MDTSVATPRLTANQHTRNGWDYLHIVERPNVHIIFPSWCSRDYSLSRIIQHVNYTQVPNFDRKIIYNGLMSREFTIGPLDQSSIPGRVILKILKIVLDAALLSTQHYKASIKGKVEQSREWSNAFPYTSV